MPDIEQSSSKSLFIKDVATYFMDFLESDFHRHKLPRRNIRLRSNDNLLVGLNLQKYPLFNKQIWRLVRENFSKDILSKIDKDAYRTNLPRNLLELIKVQISKITTFQVDSITEQIAAELESVGSLYSKDYDVALTNSLEAAAKIIQSKLVHPFVDSIKNPLQNLDLGDEGDVYLIDEELTRVLLQLLENRISEVLNLHLANVVVDRADALKSVFDPEDVRRDLITFFENLQVADLFLELFEMDRNKSILDKHDFYLYFGDVSFNNAKYPLFYIPLIISGNGNTFDLEFDSQFYINKKALEYITQETNAQNGVKGNLQTISDRIIYLSQHPGGVLEVINNVINEISNFFQLAGEVDFTSGEHKSANSASVRISNSCYICLFDKADEALVNDYEEILQQLNQDGGELSEIFNQLVDDFIEKNPIPFNPEIEEAWDNTSTMDKLVYTSAIPLNSEQQQILSAVRNDSCKYIVIGGPPGTGKSHTITAIVFDSILKNHSVLVLSDKKEALDVVEDKITQTLNKVRYDKNFQNPILRLGRTGNTYNSILARSAIDGIKTHHRAVRRDYDTLTDSIVKSGNSLKEDLEAEILAYDGINLNEIYEFLELDLYFNDVDLTYDLVELSDQEEAIIELADLRDSLLHIKQTMSSPHANELFDLLEVDPENFRTFDDYHAFLQSLIITLKDVQEIKDAFQGKLDAVSKFSRFSAAQLPKLQDFIAAYSKTKMPIFGYLFSRSKVEQLDSAFRQSFSCSPSLVPHRDIQILRDVQKVYGFTQQLEADRRGYSGNAVDFSLVHTLLLEDDFLAKTEKLASLDENIGFAEAVTEKYPKTAIKAGIESRGFHNLINNRFIDLPSSEFDKQIRYLNLRQEICREFSSIPELNYSVRMKNIEELVTTQVAHLLDGRLIDFWENSRGDAQSLRNIIRRKQRFPKNEFGKLKQAFPCILAGIRDYAEYIPLEPEIFDLVIIDEASQVSVAQAFPALIRAKKVLILGDKKQFSNVKAAQARSDTNREYLNTLDSSFKKNVSTDATKLVRLGKFNIKTSILECLEFISNFDIQLLKHFRGYKEIISYSNKYFYQDSLQVMKIRGNPLDEVIKFSFVKTFEEDQLYPNTNVKEVEFIISELNKLYEMGTKQSVGIITPHTNQQKLLVETISKSPQWNYYLNDMSLKIMTFDTCQGEERDIIFYSMVASPHSDRLWGVFIKDLAKVDIEEDGQIKAQRLNVGFSRAKESVHFVLSKQVQEFSGSIGDALRHYQNTLEEGRKERSVAEVDAKSKMEPQVMNWFYQTQFWLDHKDSIEFIPQFEIGNYLRQLDHTYSHPAYKVDFLLIYKDKIRGEQKIIIEYDGFSEHFKELNEVNKFNYQEYYSDEDVYRQKVLEGYGYKFLRINKFNVGERPVETLDKRITALIANSNNAGTVLTNIQRSVEGLQSGDMKQCPKCNGVKPLTDFKDPSLITGQGRFCNDCKNVNVSQTSTSPRTKATRKASSLVCRCGSRMVLRTGRYGRFYGCSRFPYCRETMRN